LSSGGWGGNTTIYPNGQFGYWYAEDFYLGSTYVSLTAPPPPPPAPVITGIVDYATHSNTLYQGDSSYFEIYGYSQTAGGVTPTPAVWGDGDVTINFLSWASDGQVNVSYTVAAQAAITAHTIWFQTAGGTTSLQVSIAAPPPLTINVTSGGASVAPGSTVWISADPAFPQLQANLVPAPPGRILSGNVYWQVSIPAENSPLFRSKNPPPPGDYGLQFQPAV